MKILRHQIDPQLNIFRFLLLLDENEVTQRWSRSIYRSVVYTQLPIYASICRLDVESTSSSGSQLQAIIAPSLVGVPYGTEHRTLRCNYILDFNSNHRTVVRSVHPSDRLLCSFSSMGTNYKPFSNHVRSDPYIRLDIRLNLYLSYKSITLRKRLILYQLQIFYFIIGRQLFLFYKSTRPLQKVSHLAAVLAKGS